MGGGSSKGVEEGPCEGRGRRRRTKADERREEYDFYATTLAVIRTCDSAFTPRPRQQNDNARARREPFQK